MENHQSECNFLSTVSIFSSPPLAARCPLSPLLPAAAALSFCLLLPPSALSFPSPSPLSRLRCPLLPLSRLCCPLLPLSLASAVLSFPPLSPLLSSPSPLSRLRCPLLPLSLASAVLSSPLSRLRCPLLPLSRLRCPLLPLSRLRCPLLPLSLASAVLSFPLSLASAVVFGGLQPAARLSLPLSALPLCIFLYISSLFSLLLFLFSLLLTIFYTFLSPFSPFPPPSALSLRQMWNFPILPSATN